MRQTIRNSDKKGATSTFPNPIISSHAFILSCLVTITLLFLRFCLDNQFTNWDDDGYVTANNLIKDISPAGLKAIFSQAVMGNYHPLTVLSYSIEYSIAGMSPWLYHFDNLLIHILTAILVYIFTFLLTKRKIAAVVTASLFALHPMHMETVAWVSGRKDLLCGLFYFAACVVYMFCKDAKGSKKFGMYVLLTLLFLFALLSKPIAVTLPVVLLLIDYYKNASWKKDLVEKIPLLLLSLVFGFISVKTQHAAGSVALRLVHYNLFERIELASFALTSYLWKALVPASLSCYYPYPTLSMAPGSLPPYFAVYLIIVMALSFVAYKYAGKKRVVVFGLLFFVVNVALLLQILPVGTALLADRYTYISYVGLFFIAGWYFSELFETGHTQQQRMAGIGISVIYLGILGYMSGERCKVWHDSISLWQDEIEKQPNKQTIGYDNLGGIYFYEWSNARNREERSTAYDSAFYLIKKSIELQPEDSNRSYQALAMLYYSKKVDDTARILFRKGLMLNPTPKGHLNYGNFLVMLGEADSAISEFSVVIADDPNLNAAYLNRGKLLLKQNHWQQAMKDFNESLSINPNSAESYYQRSFCDTQLGLRNLALRDLEMAVHFGFHRVDSNYYRDLKK